MLSQCCVLPGKASTAFFFFFFFLSALLLNTVTGSYSHILSLTPTCEAYARMFNSQIPFPLGNPNQKTVQPIHVRKVYVCKVL